MCNHRPYALWNNGFNVFALSCIQHCPFLYRSCPLVGVVCCCFHFLLSSILFSLLVSSPMEILWWPVFNYFTTQLLSTQLMCFIQLINLIQLHHDILHCILLHSLTWPLWSNKLNCIWLFGINSVVWLDYLVWLDLFGIYWIWFDQVLLKQLMLLGSLQLYSTLYKWSNTDVGSTYQERIKFSKHKVC